MKSADASGSRSCILSRRRGVRMATWSVSCRVLAERAALASALLDSPPFFARTVFHHCVITIVLNSVHRLVNIHLARFALQSR